ncbi:MAG: Asp23/Gls24 family envelope stress response protein [Anaerolineae bacterium]|jgi:uncharacterized alkaline shock family protein YloU
MSTAETNLGRIVVSPTAIASIASRAVSSTYGVVGVAPKNLAKEVAHIFQRDARHGVDVRIQDDQIIIDVHVIVEYGTRIASVTNSIMNVVKFNVERALGVPVAQVNVHVAGLRISNTD